MQLLKSILLTFGIIPFLVLGVAVPSLDERSVDVAAGTNEIREVAARGTELVAVNARSNENAFAAAAVAELDKRQLVAGAIIVVEWITELGGGATISASFEWIAGEVGIAARTVGAAVSNLVVEAGSTVSFDALLNSSGLTVASRVVAAFRDGRVTATLLSATLAGTSDSIAEFIDTAVVLLAPR
ncbi:hypothetical protein B0J12DRAFT_734998 [Macrophomina phaseolina]|uniref:Uncharacterized protein n=1 Tax=Macrophomina phaseolina TaxID=35725 RepID=A0ABQ8GRE2_9PEZI|nr:hypothetical protein B0J12DRAFT_734998 [Macrophomina phaseolina]